jgi:hypothetical protein
MRRFEVNVGNVFDFLSCNIISTYTYNRLLYALLFAGGSDVLAVAITRLFASTAYVSTMHAPRPRVAPTTRPEGIAVESR